MLLRLVPAHRAPLAALLAETAEFRDDERVVALELVDAALAGSPDYRFWLDQDEHGRLRGYACYGRTPMTESTFDLYWIAVDPAARKLGVGRALVARIEEEIRAEGGGLLRVETSGTSAYDATRAFYLRLGYHELARITDFYRPGDDLVMYGRRFASARHA